MQVVSTRKTSIPWLGPKKTWAVCNITVDDISTVYTASTVHSSRGPVEDLHRPMSYMGKSQRTNSGSENKYPQSSNSLIRICDPRAKGQDRLQPIRFIQEKANRLNPRKALYPCHHVYFYWFLNSQSIHLSVPQNGKFFTLVNYTSYNPTPSH